MSETIIPEVEGDDIDPATGHKRRNVFGRLYHGETSIDFYGRRKWGYAVSTLLLVVGVASLLFQGLNLGIEFEGGVSWRIPSQTLTEDQAREVLDANGLDGAEAKVTVLTSNTEQRIRTVEVQVSASNFEEVAKTTEQANALRQKIQDEYAKEVGVTPDDITTNSVSSTWGESITRKAVQALIVFMVLVALFIAWRLEWRMALAAIIAMIHDVLLSVGLYSLFGFEVTPATVVAFLTILGYSLYDTIVVFDKVKENQARYAGSRLPYADVVNVSMNQVLMRSLNTSLAAVLPVVSLLVIGAGVLGAVTLSQFALALMVGLALGSYSSIFIAAPLVGELKEREPKYRSMRGRHATGVELERLVLGGLPSGRREGVSHKRTEDQPAAPVQMTPEEVLTHQPRPRKKKRRA